jgi:hypothetical protein
MFDWVEPWKVCGDIVLLFAVITLTTLIDGKLRCP